MERIVVVDSAEWMKSSQQAHKWAFGEVRAPEMDRIDFVMLNVRDDKVLNYCTVRETDSESVYWQHGGASPDTKGTITSFKSYLRNAEWCLGKYKRITTLVENKNKAMLKIAMKVGFIIIGVRTFKGSVMLELLLEREEI